MPDDKHMSRWTKVKDCVVATCAVVGALGVCWQVYDHTFGDRDFATVECDPTLDPNNAAALVVNVVNPGRHTLYIKSVFIEWTPKNSENEWMPYHGGIPAELTAIEPGASKKFFIRGLDSQTADSIEKAGSIVELSVDSPKSELLHQRVPIDAERVRLTLLGEEGIRSLEARIKAGEK